MCLQLSYGRKASNAALLFSFAHQEKRPALLFLWSPQGGRGHSCSHHLQAHIGEFQVRMMSGIYTQKIVFISKLKKKEIIFVKLNIIANFTNILFCLIFLFPMSSTIHLRGPYFKGTVRTPHRVDAPWSILLESYLPSVIKRESKLCPRKNAFFINAFLPLSESSPNHYLYERLNYFHNIKWKQ